MSDDISTTPTPEPAPGGIDWDAEFNQLQVTLQPVVDGAREAINRCKPFEPVMARARHVIASLTSIRNFRRSDIYQLADAAEKQSRAVAQQLREIGKDMERVTEMAQVMAAGADYSLGVSEEVQQFVCDRELRETLAQRDAINNQMEQVQQWLPTAEQRWLKQPPRPTN